MHHNSIAVTPPVSLTLRQDYLSKVWCDAARCAGVASAVEPKLRELQMQPGVRRHENAREDARGDALLAMPEGMLVIDLNVVHALAVTFLQGTVAAGKSAEVDSAAAAMGEHNKEDEYRRDIDGGAYEWECQEACVCAVRARGAERGASGWGRRGCKQCHMGVGTVVS